MAPLPPTLYTIPLSFLTILFTLTIAIATLTNPIMNSITKPKKLVTQLIHHDSISSPYYDPHATMADRYKRALKTSLARFSYLYERVVDNDGMRTNLVPTERIGSIYVNFSIGQPPIPQFAILDTGSPLLWVTCLPCKGCLRYHGQIYDPTKSSTYEARSCQRYRCIFNCNSFDECTYDITYVKGEDSSGTYAFEQLMFETLDEGTIVKSHITFGCGHEVKNLITRNRKFSGIFGLGVGDKELSLITQLDSKFSYCIGNITDTKYRFNQLILGDGAILEGYSTPLKSFDGAHYINLEGINVGSKKLDINPNIFSRGLIIDTGAEHSFLVKSAYDSLRTEVESLLEGVLTRYHDSTNRLCYNGDINKDLQGFPVVTFQFSHGADLVVEAQGIFRQMIPSSVFCMAVEPGEIDDLFLIGLIAQQNYNVGYDLDKGMLYLQNIDCELLEDL